MLSDMLRDVGRLVLTEGHPDAAAQLRDVLEAEAQSPSPTRVACLEIDDYDGPVPQASAYLLGLWGFAPAIIHTIAAQPLSDGHGGVTKFEWVVTFAGLRAAHASEHVDSSLTDYLTGERLLAGTR